MFKNSQRDPHDKRRIFLYVAVALGMVGVVAIMPVLYGCARIGTLAAGGRMTNTHSLAKDLGGELSFGQGGFDAEEWGHFQGDGSTQGELGFDHFRQESPTQNDSSSQGGFVGSDGSDASADEHREWPRTVSQSVGVSDGKSFVVTVTYGEDAGVPHDAELVLTPLDNNAERQGALCNQLGVMGGEHVLGYAFVKAQLMYDGNEVQPSVPVEVVLQTNVLNPSRSDAVEASMLGNGGAIIAAENLTGIDEHGVESATPDATKIKLTAGVLGEFGLAEVVAEKFSLDYEGETITVYGPRSKVVSVYENAPDDETIDGMRVVRVLSIESEVRHAWSSEVWITGRKGEGVQGVECWRREGGQLAEPIFGRDGAYDLLPITSNNEYVLLREAPPTHANETDAEGEEHEESASQDETDNGRGGQKGERRAGKNARGDEASGPEGADGEGSEIRAGEEAVPRETLLVATGDGYAVTASFDDAAKLPKGVQLEARELTGDDYLSYVSRGVKVLGLENESVAYARVLDLSIHEALSGEKLQPADQVRLYISLSGSRPIENASVDVVHFGDVPRKLDAKAADGAVEFATNGFSVFVVLAHAGEDEGIDPMLSAQGDTAEGNGVTITTKGESKVYDGDLLAPSYEVSGLREGDSIQSLTYIDEGTGEATTGLTGVGSISARPNDARIVNAEGIDVTSEYSITYVAGTLEVTPRPVTVTAEDASKRYGDDDPELKVKLEGLVGEDGIAYEGPTREEGQDVGEYEITVTGEADQGNYTVTFKSGKFTIDPRPVTVTIVGRHDERDYDGNEHTVEGYDVTFDYAGYSEDCQGRAIQQY